MEGASGGEVVNKHRIYLGITALGKSVNFSMGSTSGGVRHVKLPRFRTTMVSRGGYAVHF
jgi:hypothetical protein